MPSPRSRFKRPVPRRIFPCLYCQKCKKDSPVIIVMLEGTPNEVELIFCPVCLDVLSSRYYGRIEWLSRQQLKDRTGYWVVSRPNRFNPKSPVSLYGR